MPTSSGVICRICTRPLRAPISVMAGIGPVCLKRQRGNTRGLLETLWRQGEAERLVRNGRVTMAHLNAVRARAAGSAESFVASTTDDDQAMFWRLFGMTQSEMQLLSDEVTRTQHRERRRRVRPTATPITVDSESATRGTEESITVDWVTEHSAIAHSGSGQNYVTTESTCTCPHFLYHVREQPERYPNGCRHMQALRVAQDMLIAEHPEHQAAIEANRQAHAEDIARTNARLSTPTAEALLGVGVQTVAPPQSQPVENPPMSRPRFAANRMLEDAEREEALDAWRETRAFDGVWIQEDDAAFERLLDHAERDWEIVTDGSVMGGTGNTFGLEIEVKFTSYDGLVEAVRKLHQDGLTDARERQRYHAHQTSGLWLPTRDGSLGDLGCEFVSPILQDTPETWLQLQHVLGVVRDHGGYVDASCGSHTNIGTGPMDSRTFNWQRLARAGVAHERTLYRLGGANSEQYRLTGRPGTHRGMGYVRPFASEVRIGDRTSVNVARQRLGGHHFNIFNCSNDGRIEMRYPNGTLDLQQIQTQVVVANAMVHQASVIRRNMPQDATTPKLLDHAQHDRMQPTVRPQVTEEQAFRRFLDFLGNPTDRAAAAWLWKRGRTL